MDSEDSSDWADAQADLSLGWAHMSVCWFCHEAAHFDYVSAMTTSKWDLLEENEGKGEEEDVDGQ